MGGQARTGTCSTSCAVRETGSKTARRGHRRLSEGPRPTARHRRVLAGRGAEGTQNAAAAPRGTLVSYKTEHGLAVRSCSHVPRCENTDLHADVCSGFIRDYRTRAATGRPSVAGGQPGSIRAVGFYSAPERREPRSQERRGGTFDPGYCVKEASLERPPPGSSQPSGLLGKAGPGSR